MRRGSAAAVLIWFLSPFALSGGANADGIVGTAAPEISQGAWINSTPLKLSDLRGKVVLLEFWALGCSNCRRTIPHLNAWYENYKGREFAIVGVHTPEFDSERDFSRLAGEVRKLGIAYPVVTDNELKTWNAYRQRYWPALYLIGRGGRVRYVHIGEGEYAETEAMIRELIDLPR